MIDSLRALAASPLVAFVTWFGLLIVIVLAFARREFRPLLTGLARLVASFFHAPIVFLRQAIVELARERFRKDAPDATSDQYLLTRFMFLLQGLLLLLAVGVLAGGLISSWRAVLPPAGSREELREAEKTLQLQQQQRDSAKASLSNMDQQWQRTKAVSVATAHKTHLDAQNKASSEMASIEATAADWGGAAPGVLSDLQARSAEIDAPSEEWEVRQAKRSLDQVISRNWHSLGDEDRQLLLAWTQRWENRAKASMEVGRLTEAEVRSQIQPTFTQTGEQVAALEEAVAQTGLSIPSKRKMAAWRIGAGARRVLLTVASFLFFIWIFGLALEASWLVIHLAVDVSHIRTAINKPTITEVREPPPSRLPIAQPEAQSVTPETVVSRTV